MISSSAVIAERARIVWLWLGGESARSISQQTGASLSTVYRWIRRWQEGSIYTKPYHRRLRNVHVADNQNLITAQRKNAHFTATGEVRSPECVPLSYLLQPTAINNQGIPVTQRERQCTSPWKRESHSFKVTNCSQMLYHCSPQNNWPITPIYYLEGPKWYWNCKQYWLLSTRKKWISTVCVQFHLSPAFWG